MAGPLSPLSPMTVNARTPETGPKTCRSIASFVTAPSATKPHFEDGELDWENGNSSPFEPNVGNENKDPFEVYDEEATPSRRKSPSKTLKLRESSVIITPPSKQKTNAKRTTIEAVTVLPRMGSQASPRVAQTPRAALPPTSTVASPRSAQSNVEHGQDGPHNAAGLGYNSIHDLRENEGLTMTTKMWTSQCQQTALSQSTMSSGCFNNSVSVVADEDINIDDTCFTTFSEIPNADMTMFARLGQSPLKQSINSAQTPRAMGSRTLGTAQTQRRDPSPTPRRSNKSPMKSKDDETTSLLLDFTQQFENFSALTASQSRSQQIPSPLRASKGPELQAFYTSKRSPGKPAVRSTPNGKKTILNLLDFELPPAPTPRSMPTITVRELESLKSNHLSELSSLKATLSGREAEVESLKRAVADAERRAGEAAEQVREEKSRREHAEQEKADWERRGKDFEEVLKKIREEVIVSEKEREELMVKLEESERRAEEAEARTTDAEARAAEANSKIISTVTTDSSVAEGSSQGLFTAEQVQKQIDEKIHALSTELHAIYKKKHVTKVAGLKKGFEAKTKEKTAELEQTIRELKQQNEDLQGAKDATLSGVHVLPSELEALRDNSKRLDEQTAELEEHKARVAGLMEEVRSVRDSHSSLLGELEAARVQNGELVCAVEDMLSLQMVEGAEPAAVEEFKRSISRPSGLRGPGFGVAGKRIARPGLPTATLSRAASSGKSRIMSDIEKMGGR